LAEIAAVRPDLVRSTPFYSLFPLLGHDSAAVRGLTVRLLGRVKANEVIFQIMALQQDMSEVIIYQRGEPVKTTVAALVTEAVAAMRQQA
jgi:hypothetical protein